MRSSICLYVLALMGMVVVAAGAHTSAESNEVVRVMLDASQNPLEERIRRYFVNVTNELLSVSQPLLQLEVGSESE